MLNQLKGVFASFHANNVRYIVIGGIAAIVHGVPRATFDLDILIEATEENAQRLLTALEEVGLGTASLISPAELTQHEITIFNDRVRVDVQTSTPGLDFKTGWANKQTINYQGQPFFVVNKEDLIASKRAAGRPVDMADVEALENL